MDRFTRLSRKFGLSSNRPGDSQTEKEHSSSEKEQTEEPFQPTIQIQRKLVIVGNAGCGKTCLLSRFHKNEFPEVRMIQMYHALCDGSSYALQKFVPSVYESCGVQEISEGSGPTVYLQLWDTSSQDCYERLRPLSYTQTDVVLICFAIDDRESLKTVEEYVSSFCLVQCYLTSSSGCLRSIIFCPKSRKFW